jgi:hypothetical protein
MRAASTVMASLLCAACATVPVAPDWYGDGATCDESRTLPDGGRRYCGTAAAESEEEALLAARAAALGRAAASILIRLTQDSDSEITCTSVEGPGGDKSACVEKATQRLKASTGSSAFRNVPVEKKRVERRGRLHQAWVALRLPGSELDRLRRTALGQTLVAVDCRLGKGACPAAILDELTTALQKCGIARAGGFVRDIETPEQAVKRALDKDLGRALLVSLRADAARVDGLALSAAEGRWELFDTGDARTLAAQGLPSREVPGSSEEAAMKAALKAAVARLSAHSCGMSEAQGSLCCIDLETGASRE